MWSYSHFLCSLWFWPHSRFTRIRNFLAHRPSLTLWYIISSLYSVKQTSANSYANSPSVELVIIPLITKNVTPVVSHFNIINKNGGPHFQGIKEWSFALIKIFTWSNPQRPSWLLSCLWLKECKMFCYSLAVLSNHKVSWICALIPKISNFVL